MAALPTVNEAEAMDVIDHWIDLIAVSLTSDHARLVLDVLAVGLRRVVVEHAVAEHGGGVLQLGAPLETVGLETGAIDVLPLFPGHGDDRAAFDDLA